MLAAAAVTCSLAAARATVRATPLVVPPHQSISSSRFRVSPRDVDRVICLELPGGLTAMALTVASGGTAGDINWAIYVGGKSGFRVSLVRGGYGLSLAAAGSDLVETEPVYARNDPNCCPSRFDHTRWHWNGTRFAVTKTWQNTTYKP